jgi:hypothetical protein
MVVMKTLDVDTFKNYFEKFVFKLKTDPNTFSFYQYLDAGYGKEPKNWAYCYRTGLRINTNMALEAMHRIIKYNYFKGRSIHRLDEGIYLICEFLNDREKDWFLSYNKGKSTRKHSHI